MRKPKLSPKQRVYKDNYQQIYRITAEFDTHSKEYFVRDGGERVGVVIVKNKSVLLTRQYRLLINDLSWEIPGGKIDYNETPEDAAIRECLEETGILCNEIQPLITFEPGLDITKNRTYIFNATNISITGSLDKESHEVDHTEWVPIDQCTQMIFQGDIVDGLSIVAILAYQTNNPVSGN